MNAESAKTMLHESKNKVARTLLGYVSTCNTSDEAINLYNTIQDEYSKGTIVASDYEALIELYKHLCTKGLYKGRENNVVDCFRQNIWTTTDMSRVMQFRNCVTDMLMLDFITIDDYVGLNNEIDRYIQYALSNGGLK